MTQNVQFSQGVLPPKPNLLNESLKCGDADFVRLALQKNILPDARTLTCAFMSEKVEVIEYTRSTLQAVPDDKTLTTAVASNRVALVCLAISYSAIATEETYLVAQKINNPEILALLKSAPRSTSTPLPPVNRVLEGGPDNAVTRASKIGSAKAVQRALQTQPVQRQTLLAAAESGDRSIVHQVIEKGAAPHRVPGKKSELSAACQAKDLEMVNELIIRGAEPDKTTLSLAYSSKKMAIVDAVLKAGARGDEDPNCLTIAVQNFPRDKEAIRKAIKAGAKPNNSPDEQNTLNCLIESSGSDDVCNVLFDAGARPINSNNEYNTVLLSIKKRTDLHEVLIARGATPSNDPTGTHNTLDFVHISDMDVFIDAGAKASRKSLSQYSKYHSESDRKNYIEKIMKAGGARLDSDDAYMFQKIMCLCPKLTPQFIAAGGKMNNETIPCFLQNRRRGEYLEDWVYECVLALYNAGARTTDDIVGNFKAWAPHHKDLSKENKQKFERMEGLLKKVRR